jgi:hypothetical protein
MLHHAVEPKGTERNMKLGTRTCFVCFSALVLAVPWGKPPLTYA